MITKERFAEGLTLQQYLAQMGMNRDRFVRAFDAARPDDPGALDKLGNAAKLLVITEDWCGTSLAYFPAVAKLAAGRPDIEMRIFLRDENPDVMDQFLKRGLYRSIPVFAFFDDDMNELARFIEQPLA
ncbi:MAG TPA: thioredoxin family protein [Candidatus Acidoferrum sp.]|nr:thioredoxin family protein [Candidatus Acidoferrum sp.]